METKEQIETRRDMEREELALRMKAFAHCVFPKKDAEEFCRQVDDAKYFAKFCDDFAAWMRQYYYR